MARSAVIDTKCGQTVSYLLIRLFSLTSYLHRKWESCRRKKTDDICRVCRI